MNKGEQLLEINKIYQGDCLEVMKDIDDKSIDMILCDLPYGITACKWDKVIPLDKLWNQYKRIIKDNGAIVLTASQPFTSALVMSNPAMFRYCWVWDKVKGGNIFNLKNQPYKVHEDIAVFSIGTHQYFPIKVLQKKRKGKTYGIGEAFGGGDYGDTREYTDKNPRSIIEISNADQHGKEHPTQKPVALFEYLIKTYTNENELVLDNCIGSGTTAIACMQTNRNYIGIEIEHKYVEIANKRIDEFKQQLTLIK